MSIDIERLAVAFVLYMRSHPTSTLVASCDIAFESWFRVELAATLMMIGITRDEIQFRCPIPESSDKADLMTVSASGKVAFELKCFVAGADAQKLDAFPGQIRRLEQHVRNGTFAQGIVFATLYGYSETRAKTIRATFFPDSWKSIGPFPVVEGHALEFVVGEFHNDKPSVP